MKTSGDDRRRQHEQHLLPLAPQEPVVDRSDQEAEHDQDRQVGAGRHAVDAGNRQPETRACDDAPVARAVRGQRHDALRTAGKFGDAGASSPVAATADAVVR